MAARAGVLRLVASPPMPDAPAPPPSADELSPRERELLDATIAVLEEHGYDRFTVDEVASRAHASKATIYRRWPSKAALVIAAMAARMRTPAFLAAADDEVDLRDELLQLVELLAAEGCELRATIAAVLGEGQRNEEFRATLEEHFVAPRRERMRATLERHRAAGAIRKDADLDLVDAVPSAIVYQRLLITGEPVDEQLPAKIVDGLMMPLLR
jgi:AcrR family transcriptional regulator